MLPHPIKLEGAGFTYTYQGDTTLAQLGPGAIIDEIQYVPALLSYVQVLADQGRRNGLYVLTGSEQFKLSGAISQSLAGRTALLRLLPLTIREWRADGGNDAVDEMIFAGRLERLDVEQEVSSFVERRLAPEPDRSDVDVLDAVGQRHVRRVLEGLDPGCRKLGDSLFNRFSTQELAGQGTSSVQGMPLLDAGSWEQTKEHHIIDRGFALSDENAVELGKEYHFGEYTGKSKRGFGVNLKVTWKLGTEGFSRSIAIDAAVLPGLDSSIAYSEVGERGPDADHVVGQVLQGLLATLGDRSGS